MLKRGLSQPGRIARQAALCSAFALLTACGGDFFKKPDGMVGSSSAPSNSSTSSSGQESSSSAVSSSIPVPSSSLSSSSQGNGGEGFKLTIQSEDFDRFSDTTDTQEGTCGDGAVDMGAAKPGEPGNCDVGWTNAGEWLDFDFNMPEAGTFTIALGLGSDVADRSVEILVNGQSMGSLSVPQIGWEAFEEVAMTDIDIDAGATTLRVLFTTGATNFDYVRLEQTDFVAQPSSSSSVSSSSSSVPPVEDDDNDGVANDVDACPDTQGTTLFNLVTGESIFYGEMLPIVDGAVGDKYLHRVFITENGDLGTFSSIEALFSNGHAAGAAPGEDKELAVQLAPGAGLNWICEVGAACEYERSDYFTLLVDETGVPIGIASTAVQSADFDFMPPAGSGYVNNQGCAAAQLDDDQDGVSNDVDACLSTPAGSDIEKDGCALFELDSDFDGVDDSADQCPLTIEGEVDDQGCAESQKDSDEDGITDDLDQCPSTDADATVDAVGCADNQLDGDNDGVNNTEDSCPNTPANEDVDTAGCSESQKDDDSDGVMNDADQCPGTAESEQADTDGCSDSQIDSDNDGVVDSIDQCPETSPEDVVNDEGCGLLQTDGDSDGVENDLDQCPNTPDGEPVDSDGCSNSQKDDDGDGVSNGLDQCPATLDGATVDDSGCSQAQRDDDLDGVPNGSDQCPNTASGQDSDDQGCSYEQRDDDQDGIANGLDQCSGTPSDEQANSEGCSPSQTVVDTDEDGVSDEVDQCPSTTAGASVDANGCSEVQRDDDADGVNNGSDQCPSTNAGETVDGSGCSNAQLDDDDDGVANGVDQCPATDSGATVDTAGCSESQRDDDSDGVVNGLDQCPATDSGVAVDGAGCSEAQRDDDNDGVVNGSDQCPSTNAGETVDASGCSNAQRDDDGDGVANGVDQCPATISGESVDGSGCSQDQRDDDQDGVANGADQCPATTPGASVDNAGCAEAQRDDDSDGVLNAADLCPATPSNELPDANGCSDSQKDSDNDGVSDAVDLCPESTGPVNSAGCSADQRDSDADGIADSADQCDNTPTAETAGPDGCSVSQIDAAALFDGSCKTCHGAEGEGASQAAVYGKTAQDLRNIIVSGTLMPTVAGDLTDPQIEALGILMSNFPVPDSDSDGVVDNEDSCPDSAGNLIVDQEGCTSDQLIGNPIDGAEAWTESGCVNCHGNFANQQGVTRAIDPDNLTATSIESIAGFIELNMQYAGECKGQCAADAAAYVLTLAPEPNVSNGRALYATSCSTCHGEIREGFSVYPELSGETIRAKYGDFDLLVQKVSQMSSQFAPSLSNSDHADIAAFLQTDGPSAANGQALYSNCTSCHGDKRQGSGNFPNLFADSISANYDSFSSLVSKVETMNAYASNALSGDDFEDVAAFLLSELGQGDASVGASLFGTNSCTGCHGDSRQGVGSFPELSGATIRSKYPSFDNLVKKVVDMGAPNTSAAVDIARFLMQD